MFLSPAGVLIGVARNPREGGRQCKGGLDHSADVQFANRSIKVVQEENAIEGRLKPMSLNL